MINNDVRVLHVPYEKYVRRREMKNCEILGCMYHCMRVFEYSIAFSRIMLLGDGSILRIEETSCSQRSVIISMPPSRGQVSTGRNARASIYKKSAVVDADPIMNASQSSSDDGYANQPYFTLVVDNT